MCELGAGLGVVSILLEKLNCTSRIVCTDGDDDTIVALRDNLSRAECSAVEVEKLYWGEWSEFKLKYALFDIIVAADVIYEEGQVIPLLSTVKEIMQGKFHISVESSMYFCTFHGYCSFILSHGTVHLGFCAKKCKNG